jgi:hypothetical protein
MKKRACLCLLALALMIIPTMALAEEPEHWGELVIDGGDYRVYRVYENTESIRDAMDAENNAPNGSSKSRIKGLLTYAESGSGIPRPWFTVGTSIKMLGDGLSLPLPEYSLPLVSTRSSGPLNPKGRLASKAGFMCCHPLKVDCSPCLSLRIHQ